MLEGGDQLISSKPFACLQNVSNVLRIRGHMEDQLLLEPNQPIVDLFQLHGAHQDCTGGCAWVPGPAYGGEDLLAMGDGLGVAVYGNGECHVR